MTIEEIINEGIIVEISDGKITYLYEEKEKNNEQ